MFTMKDFLALEDPELVSSGLILIRVRLSSLKKM